MCTCEVCHSLYPWHNLIPDKLWLAQVVTGRQMCFSQAGECDGVCSVLSCSSISVGPMGNVYRPRATMLLHLDQPTPRSLTNDDAWTFHTDSRETFKFREKYWTFPEFIFQNPRGKEYRLKLILFFCNLFSMISSDFFTLNLSTQSVFCHYLTGGKHTLRYAHCRASHALDQMKHDLFRRESQQEHNTMASDARLFQA